MANSLGQLECDTSRNGSSNGSFGPSTKVPQRPNEFPLLYVPLAFRRGVLSLPCRIPQALQAWSGARCCVSFGYAERFKVHRRSCADGSIGESR